MDDDSISRGNLSWLLTIAIQCAVAGASPRTAAVLSRFLVTGASLADVHRKNPVRMGCLVWLGWWWLDWLLLIVRMEQ